MTTETELLLAPQLRAMLDSEAYHYCADCHTHCRQTILAVEAAKEAVKAHASDAEQLSELRKVCVLVDQWFTDYFAEIPCTVPIGPITARLRAVLTPQKEKERE